MTQERLIEYKDLTSSQKEMFEELVQEAVDDPYVGGEWLIAVISKSKDPIASKVHKIKLIAILKGSKIVGLFNPRLMSNGYWRSGVIYVEKKSRGEGIMFRVLRDFFSTHCPATAWIADNNKASIGLYTKLGFKKDRPFKLSSAEKDQGHWYNLDNLHQLAMETYLPCLSW
jgi:GNAT superfamily N-acetyltransferase